MEPIFLTEYLQSHLFLHDLEEQDAFGFDLILTDFVYQEKSSLPLISLQDHPKNENFIEHWGHLIQEHQKCLIILSEFSPFDLKDLLHRYAEKITLLNLYAGIGSLGHKQKPETHDLDVMEEYQIFEPLDLNNLFDLLRNSQGERVIRIPHALYERNIFSDDEIAFIDQQNLTQINSFSLIEYGFMGDQATILATWSNFPTLLHLGEALQEANFWADCFCLVAFDAWNNEKILQSLKKTKHLILLIDHENTPSLFKELKAYCREKEIETVILTPHYDNITTIFWEYSLEQAEFDAEHLVERILHDHS